MMDFLAFCRGHGVLIDSLPPAGVWRRYKTDDKPKHRNGAVKWMGDHGFVQNHATMTEVAVWRPDGDAAQHPPVDPSALARQRVQERERRIAAMHGARQRWSQCARMHGLHPYLARKGLSAEGCIGLRVYGDQLVVPVRWGESLTSIQTINAEGEKRFWPGAPVKGGAYVMERPRAALTAICEGLATGLALYQCLRHARVVVAFDAGNLMPVVQRLNPQGSVVICADNDHGTQARTGINPGLQKAENAAELIGAGVAWPEGIEGTDWADALMEWGRQASKRIERLILAKARYVMS